jgi:hypothetical protein
MHHTQVSIDSEWRNQSEQVAYMGRESRERGEPAVPGHCMGRTLIGLGDLEWLRVCKGRKSIKDKGSTALRLGSVCMDHKHPTLGSKLQI